MEQQLENHMRLPPPVTTSASPNGADSTTALHQPPRQQMQAEQQASSQSHGTLPSPPFVHANPTLSRGAGSAQHQQIPSSSSLSPPTLGQVPSYSPPAYAFSQQPNHDPATLNLPEAPSNELAPLQLSAHGDSSLGSLPSLASLTGASTTSSLRFAPPSAARDTSYSPPPRLRHWPSGNPYSAYYAAGHGHSADSPARMDMDNMSNGTRGPLSPDHLNGGASSVSLDDPDVRMAAEALGHLKADFVSSPQNKNNTMPTSPPNHFGTPGPPEAEPLLSLVLSSGSLLARPIEGTVTAYNTTKNFSPGFIKAPVEYVEGVVGSGFHMSGIEGGVRWFFRGKGRHPSSGDLETGESSHKRRKVGSRGSSMSAPRRSDASGTVALTSSHSPEMEPFSFSDKDRRLSVGTVDTLPAYDDARSPAYTENAMAAPNGKTMSDSNQATPTNSRPSSTNPAWQQRLMMSTSGLSIAMSEESLRSLKYCLTWLRWANDHIGRVITALKDALEKYDSQHPRDAAMGNDAGGAKDPEHARRELSARVIALRSDVLKTLTSVIETVSKYTGGALPENARLLVRRHLKSLPQRFMLATQENANANGNGASPAPATEEGAKEKDAREGAHRVLVMAKEGLDMMAQVSCVLDGTIVSAEEWCERLGRKKREQSAQSAGRQQEQGQGYAEQQAQTVAFTGVGVGVDGDVKMG